VNEGFHPARLHGKFQAVIGLAICSTGKVYRLGDLALNQKQNGFINGASLTLLIGGLVLGGLLIYSLKSGQELPLWPAIAVCLVNLIAAAKIILDVKKARKPRRTPPA